MKQLMPSPLLFADWPASDRAAWDAATSGDPLAPGGGGAASHWRPATRDLNKIGYGCWLGWLLQIGALDRDVGPAERASRFRVRQYYEALRAAGVADYTCASRLQTLGDTLRMMSAGAASFTYITRAAGRVSRNAKRLWDPGPMMRPPGELLALGEGLMRAAEDEEALPRFRRAIAFRDGLLISLWVLRPLRISNLAQIEIDRHLIRGQNVRLEFAAEEMKSNRRFGCDWPHHLLSALDRYLTEFRPLLLSLDKGGGRPTDALWVSQFGKAMPTASVGQIIELRTKAAFGRVISPHRIRHIVATAVAENDPGRVMDVPSILGHASLEASEQHYILAGTYRAVERYQSALGAPRARRRK